MNLSGDFSVEDWADFVRGVGSSDLRVEMLTHLDEGCPGCTAAHRAWTRILDTARSEGLYDPPPAALRMAKALYPLPTTEGPLPRAMEAARLIFDSHLSPAAAGVRGAVPAPRKLLYATGPLVVDLQLQGGLRRTDPSVLIGQVTDANTRHCGVEGVAVLVVSLQQTIARTRTNQLGEFCVEIPPRTQDLSLSLGWEQGGAVISLDGLTKVDS